MASRCRWIIRSLREFIINVYANASFSNIANICDLEIKHLSNLVHNSITIRVCYSAIYNVIQFWKISVLNLAAIWILNRSTRLQRSIDSCSICYKTAVRLADWLIGWLQVRETLLRRHRHLYEKNKEHSAAKLPIIRSLADIGRNYSTSRSESLFNQLIFHFNVLLSSIPPLLVLSPDRFLLIFSVSPEYCTYRRLFFS